MRFLDAHEQGGLSVSPSKKRPERVIYLGILFFGFFVGGGTKSHHKRPPVKIQLVGTIAFRSLSNLAQCQMRGGAVEQDTTRYAIRMF